MYAVIEENGKQFKVSTGDRIKIDRKLGDAKSVTFDRVLLVSGDGSAKIGAPVVAGASVSADVIGEMKDKKVVTVKYARRKGYHKKVGHRQQYTEVKITAINA